MSIFQCLISYLIPFNKNPFTGDSTGKRIFKVCGNGFPDSTIINDTWVTPQFRDTFELMKDFWYDTIVTLPEKCGKWQIRNSIGPTNNYSCSLMGTSFGLNTNLDTVLDNFPDPDFNDINALLQFNSTIRIIRLYFYHIQQRLLLKAIHILFQ
ncbi:MAG: hypothetical protein HWD58_12840 [Bacteroidota bacterium]|nr:MAG: hypothetical protein HWD58_12840 [Bacteroidota bacterium]